MKVKTLAIVMLIFVISISVFAQEEFKIKLNNLVLEFDESTMYPAELDGSMFVPLRKLAESANAVVEWTGGCAAVNIRGSSIKIKV